MDGCDVGEVNKMFKVIIEYVSKCFIYITSIKVKKHNKTC